MVRTFGLNRAAMRQPNHMRQMMKEYTGKKGDSEWIEVVRRNLPDDRVTPVRKLTLRDGR